MNNEHCAYCRLCAEQKPINKLINLQRDDGILREISDKLTRLSTIIDFNAQILPHFVCLVCTSLLDTAYEFVISVERAQESFSNRVLVQSIKKEEDGSDTDNYICDSPNVKCEEPVDCEEPVNVKLEPDKDKSESKPVLNLPQRKQHKKKFKVDHSFDAIPLSQLKLTWKDYSWECAYCGTQFPTIDELKAHSMQYHESCNPYRCIDCNIRKLKLESFLIHVRRHRNYLKFSCYKCFARFSNAHEAKVHKKSHILSEPVCPGCSASFASEEELTHHINAHSKDKKSRHIPKVHIDDSLVCILCNKTFKHRGSLTSHLLTHTERKRNHICDICGKCFLTKQNLQGHMILHDDTRPYQCEICKHGFKTPAMLRAHVGVHDGKKPFSCTQCGRCFRLQKQLNSHSIIHTDSLPYICVYCNKSFRFKTILNQHLRQHTGIKPYSCQLCVRDFTNWPNYNKHMKRRHGMDMAKKKHTPEGLFPIDPKTGEVVLYPETNKTLEWKKDMMTQRKPGRPKVKIEVEIKQNDMESLTANVTSECIDKKI